MSNSDIGKLIRKMSFVVMGVSIFSLYNDGGYDLNPKNVNKTAVESKKKVKLDDEQNYVNRYAIIISGHEERPFNEEIMAVYDSLKKGGYSDDDIYVLAPNNDFIPDDRLDGISDYAGIFKAFDDVGKKSSKEDSFLLYITDHGLYTEAYDTSHVGITNGAIFDFNVDWFLELVDYKTATVIVDACHSGGFADKVGKDNVVALSSSSKHGLSYKPSKFSRFVVKNFYEQDLDADANSDGKVSLEEAIDRAAKEDWVFTRVEDWPYRRFLPLRHCPQLKYQDVDPSKLYPK